MIECMMKLPEDMFRQDLLPYLILDDIVRLDNACTNHEYRSQLLEKISGVILKGDRERCLGLRRIYLSNMNLAYVFNESTTYTIQNNDDYIDQFRYIQHIVIRGEGQGKFRPYIDLLDSFSTCISNDKHCSSGMISIVILQITN
jgi:hypothetical protein